jgi:hypothetical protein
MVCLVDRLSFFIGPSHGGDRKAFDVMTLTLPLGTIGSIVYLLSATPFEGNPDTKHKLWNMASA